MYCSIRELSASMIKHHVLGVFNQSFLQNQLQHFLSEQILMYRTNCAAVTLKHSIELGSCMCDRHVSGT